jgi:hypothetical protein
MRRMSAALHALAVGAQIVRLPGHPVDVRTRAEPASRTGHDDDANGVVEAQLGEVVAQALAHLDAQRVEFLRAVQHDIGDRTFDRQINRHSVSPEARLDYNRRGSQRPGVLIPEQVGHRFRFDLGHTDLKPATLGVAIARPLSGRISLLVMMMTGGGTDASRESVDATCTRDPAP